jgi:hypothetical protein
MASVTLTQQLMPPTAPQIYVHAHSSLRDDAQEWAAALTALMDASRPTAAAFLAGFVAKARPDCTWHHRHSTAAAAVLSAAALSAAVLSAAALSAAVLSVGP